MITQSRLEVRGAQPTWRRPGGFDDGSKRQPDEGVAYKSQTCFVKTPGPSTRKSGGDVRRHFTALFSHHLLFPLILLLPPSDPPLRPFPTPFDPLRLPPTPLLRTLRSTGLRRGRRARRAAAARTRGRRRAWPAASCRLTSWPCLRNTREGYKYFVAYHHETIIFMGWGFIRNLVRL